MRIAWFSPLPPDRSGIAAYSAEITSLLRPHFDDLDLFTGDRHEVRARTVRAGLEALCDALEDRDS